jgi:hypothetical protein
MNIKYIKCSSSKCYKYSDLMRKLSKCRIREKIIFFADCFWQSYQNELLTKKLNNNCRIKPLYWIYVTTINKSRDNKNKKLNK